MKPKKVRVDQLLVERGVCGDLETARRRVMTGTVRVDGQTALAPSQRVPVTLFKKVRRPT